VPAAWAACTVHDEGIFVSDRPMALHMLAERCVRGPEFSVELLVRGGKPLFANVTAKLLFPGPHPVELAHMVPADIPDDLTALLVERTTAVLTAVDFGDGIAHCEWIVENGVPHLVECAGRIPGDGIMEIIDRTYDTRLLHTYFALMKGEPLPELPRHARRGGAIRFVTADIGAVVAVHGLDAAREVDGVFLADVPAAGRHLTGLRNSWDRPGLVMATADTSAEALRRAEKAAGLVHVEVTPEPETS
jgi:hypothetical protein